MYGILTTKHSAYRTAFVMLATVCILLLPDTVLAGSLENVVKNGLCEIIQAFTGEVGKALATLAVLFLGIGAFFGKVNWGVAVMFAFGIVGIFGAAAIAAQIASGAGGTDAVVGCVASNTTNQNSL